jgi:hypothetical protein
MRAEYKHSDFKKLERGKFYQRVVAGSNVVVLDPKVAKAFPSSAIVNQTLKICSNWRKNRLARNLARAAKSPALGKGRLSHCVDSPQSLQGAGRPPRDHAQISQLFRRAKRV